MDAVVFGLVVLAALGWLTALNYRKKWRTAVKTAIAAARIKQEYRDE